MPFHWDLRENRNQCYGQNSISGPPWADLGIIVSAYLYDHVIRQHGGQPIGAADYRKIRFRVKESALTAWIHLTGALADDEAERVAGRVAVDPPRHRLAAGA